MLGAGAEMVYTTSCVLMRALILVESLRSKHIGFILEHYTD